MNYINEYVERLEQLFEKLPISENNRKVKEAILAELVNEYYELKKGNMNEKCIELFKEKLEWIENLDLENAMMFGVSIDGDLIGGYWNLNPYSREMYISLGCALENLTIAARAKGLSPKIIYFPDKRDSRHIATIDLTTMSPQPSELYDAIPERQDKLKIGQAMVEATETLISDKEQIDVMPRDYPRLRVLLLKCYRLCPKNRITNSGLIHLKTSM